MIADGTALVNWVLHIAKIPPERITILGQSLGTAVSSAIALNFADPSNEIIPRSDNGRLPLLSSPPEIATPTTFAGVILVAPFYSLPSLLLTYRLGGLIPLLLPLRPFPWLANALTSRMIDTWPSAKRLSAYYHAFSSQPKLLHHKDDDFSGDGSSITREMGTLQIIHAKTDMDISYVQTEKICEEIFGEGQECVAGDDGLLLNVKEAGKPRVRVQVVEHGGE